jgi:hypothetical protein
LELWEEVAVRMAVGVAVGVAVGWRWWVIIINKLNPENNNCIMT